SSSSGTAAWLMVGSTSRISTPGTSSGHSRPTQVEDFDNFLEIFSNTGARSARTRIKARSCSVILPRTIGCCGGSRRARPTTAWFHAQTRGAQRQPPSELNPAPPVHINLATLAALAVADEDRASTCVQVLWPTQGLR